MTIQCCVCRKVRDDHGWSSAATEAKPEQTSHGYCPACLKDVYRQIKAARYRALVPKPI